MSSNTAGSVAPESSPEREKRKMDLGDYGLLLVLIAIMIYFQITTSPQFQGWWVGAKADGWLGFWGHISPVGAITELWPALRDGILFKPLNVTNIVLQNSYIIVMALGMLLVIVAGHIDLSVGSVSGFIGGVAAVMMVDWGYNPVLAAVLCIILGAMIGGIQGYFISYWKMPSFIVTLSGMLVFKGLLLWLLGGRSVGPFPVAFQALSAGFIPDVIGPLWLVAPTLDAQGVAMQGTGFSLHLTTIVIGLAIVALWWWFEIRNRMRNHGSDFQTESAAAFLVKNLVVTAIVLFFIYKFASYRGLPNVLIVMGILIALFVFVTRRMTFGRRVYAIGGNAKAASMSGINTERLTFYIFAIMGALAALAGLIYAARLNMATPKAGQGLELDVIAAVFVGGASALGGVGQVAGAVIGAFIMGVMNNGMGMQGLNIDMQQVVKGLVLFGAVAFDLYNKKKAA